MSAPGGHAPRLRAWAYLSRVVEGPCAPLIAALAKDDWDPEPLAERIRERRGLTAELESATRARYAHDGAERDLAILDALGGRLVTRDDPEWPAGRLGLLGGGGEADGSPPVALWTVGALDLGRLDGDAIAIVGTRAATGYGEHVASDIAADLAEQGYVVVSGAAYGIDGAAHRAALSADGATVAVLACGVDRAYPAGHTRLLRAIGEHGAVVSEYPPGTVPGRHRFLARNRLVAGLAAATVVVEAGARSGAINTAGWAARFHRHLLAVPGPVTSASSVGSHHLLRRYHANIATGAADVIEVVGPIGTLPSVPDEQAPPRRPTDALDAPQLAVHDALPARGARTCEELAVESGVPVPRVMAALAVLEVQGLAARVPRGWARAGGRDAAGGPERRGSPGR